MTTQATAEATLSFEEALAAYEPVMGLEVHVELNTATKMFCGCPTEFGAEPNTQVCPVCLGLPGALPVVNDKAVESAIRIGLVLRCEIAQWCRFARKNYFYPDMPKNFQTSQYDEPIAFDGFLDVELDDGTVYRVEIERAHMEEDTGKSLHVGGSTGRIHGATHSLVDYNRAGIPLIEIVTKPMRGAGERAPEIARAYVATLRDLLKALDVSDVRMEQGSVRCDVNLSLMPKGADRLGTRTETKNVNSLRSVERAVRYEIGRQAAVLSSGGSIVQETRHWHEDTGVTTSGRVKSDADDYRYFPEPDLVPVAPTAEMVEALRGTLPEPPVARRRRLQTSWGFSDLEMRDVVNAGLVELVEETVRAGASAGRRAQVVVGRDRPAGQRRRTGRPHVCRLARRRADPRGRARVARAAWTAQRLHGASGLGGACSRGRGPPPPWPTPAGSSSSRTPGRSRRLSTRSSPRTRTSPPRSATGRSPRPVPSSGRSCAS